MGKTLLLVIAVFVLVACITKGSEEIFDLSRVDYFDNCHFEFLQITAKTVSNPGIHRKMFMPPEGELQIDYQSRKQDNKYEIVTITKHKDKTFYTIKANVDRFGIIQSYVMYDNEGNTLLKILHDNAEKEAVIEVRREDGNNEIKRVPIYGQAYSIMTIPYIIGAVDPNDRERKKFSALIGDGKRIGLFLQLVKEETISVGDQAYDCYRLECGLAGLIGLFLPKLIFWVDKESRIPIRYDMMGTTIIELDRIYDIPKSS